MEAIERELTAEAIAGTAAMMLDPNYLAIPLNILFDLTSEGTSEVAGPQFADALEAKALHEWGLADGMAPIAAEVWLLPTSGGARGATWEDEGCHAGGYACCRLLALLTRCSLDENAAGAASGETDLAAVQRASDQVHRRTSEGGSGHGRLSERRC